MARNIKKRDRLSIAERGWLGAVIDDHLRPALKFAEEQASDLDKLAMCDIAGCGRVHDATDPRASTVVDHGTTYHFCAACEIEHDVGKAEAALAKARAMNPRTETQT